MTQNQARQCNEQWQRERLKSLKKSLKQSQQVFDKHLKQHGGK